jgi:hypothetical protein
MRPRFRWDRAAQPNSLSDTNVGSKAEVDAVIGQAHRAGATITDPPHEAFWGGYTGSFQDPDGHLWEVAWNPDMYPAE